MAASMPLFSIIVPVFNTPLDYVRQALKSVQAQTLVHECELVIWDDGSSLAYKQDLYQLINSLSGVAITFGESKDNVGLCHARNAAIERATGEWLLLLDADDYLDQYILEHVKRVLAPDVELVYTDHIFISSDGSKILHERSKAEYQRLHRQFKGSLYDPMLHATFIFHCQIFRRTTFLRLNGFRTDLKSGEEVDLQLRISEISQLVNYGHVPEYLYFYRDNPVSVCHNANYYSNLISNLEQILVEAAQRRGFPIISAQRIGRANNTHAAHYLLRSQKKEIRAPWFDYEALVVHFP